MKNYAKVFEEEIIGKWIDEKKETPESIEKKFKKLNKQYEILYNFILAFNAYSTLKKNYNSGEDLLSMTEAHILLDIVDHPGITVTELAKKRGKTSSAISQTIKTLIKKEFISREISSSNAKFFLLSPTDKGIRFTYFHKNYDNIDIIKTSKSLLKKFSLDEIITFYKVMEEYTKLLKK